MTDRRSITNGKAPRRPSADVPKATGITIGQYMHPDHRHRPVLRGEMFHYCDALAESIAWRQRENRLHRRVGRHLRALWTWLVTPRVKA